MSILIIDDSLSFRLLLENFLKKSGYLDILTAESPIESFEILGLENSSNTTPDVELIIMDINMPEMDGIEGCKKIKSHKNFKDIPIVILTAENNKNRLNEALQAGAVDHLNKPLDRKEFLAKISKYLNKN